MFFNLAMLYPSYTRCTKLDHLIIKAQHFILLYMCTHIQCVWIYRYISTLKFFVLFLFFVNETKIYLTTMFLRTKCFSWKPSVVCTDTTTPYRCVRLPCTYLKYPQTSISRNIENTISECCVLGASCRKEKEECFLVSTLIVYFKWVKMYAHILHFVFVWIMYWKIVWKIAPP